MIKHTFKRRPLASLMVAGALMIGPGVAHADYYCTLAVGLAQTNIIAQIQTSTSSIQSDISSAEQSINNQTKDSENNISDQMTEFQESLEDLLIKIAKTLQGEIGKQTQAIRATQESIATYEIQESLRREAAQVSEKLEQPAFVCQTMAMTEGIRTATQAARGRAASFTKTRVDSMMTEASPRHRILNNYNRSTSKFCTEQDISAGRCTGTPQLVNGDISASHLFGAANGGGLTYLPGQTEAVDAYIDRIAGTPPAALPVKCDTEQCKAFEETRKDYAAFLSLPVHSLAEVASAYMPQQGLATQTGTKEILGKDDVSMMEAIEGFIKMKFSKEGIMSSGEALSPEKVLRELAQNQGFRLWMDFQNMRQLERIEAMQAAELAIVGGAHMRGLVEAQRQAAVYSMSRQKEAPAAPPANPEGGN